MRIERISERENTFPRKARDFFVLLLKQEEIALMTSVEGNGSIHNGDDIWV